MMRLSKEEFVSLVMAHQKARKQKRKQSETNLNNYMSDNHFRIARRCK